MTRPRWGFALVPALLLSLIAAAPARADVPHATFRAATAAPSDDLWPFQWALENAGAKSPYHGEAVEDADIDAEAAWDAAPADEPTVTVAVVDERVDPDQPDLAGRFADLPAGPAVPNGPGCAATHPDHGTAVAGIVAAIRDNDQGIAGVAANARILPVPALDDCGTGTTDTVLDAFRYATAQHAEIVVGSFASDPLLAPETQAALQRTFDDFFAQHLDTLFVVAAGNEGNDNDVNPVYPCSSHAENVLCVGRSDMDDSPSCRSNVGEDSVDLFAPGDRIWSTKWSDGEHASVAAQTGTSMSAPLVAGVAALVWFVPLRTPTAAAAKAAILDGVDSRAAMAPISASDGRLNAAGALAAAGVDEVKYKDERGSGQGRAWHSCDPDHDGLVAPTDKCPDAAANTQDGCPPDADSDGVPDSSDNCPGTANAGQANADGDNLGDACDPTPRGPDVDADGFPALDDQCPTQPGTVGGCPAQTPYTPPYTPPSPPPVVTPAPVTPVALDVISVRVSAHRCKAHGPCRRTAKVTVTLTRTASTAVTVQQRVKRHHRWVWKRVLRRSLTATSRGRTLTVRRLGRGTYRVTAAVAGARTKRRTFRI